MVYEWNWWAVPWTLLMPASVALAMLVFYVRPDRFQNRVLALMLATEGIVLGTSGGLIYFAADARTAIAWQHVGMFFAVPMLVLYPLFMTTISTPWTRWIPRRPFVYAGVALVLALWVAWLSTPAWDVQSTHATYYASHEADGSAFLSFAQVSTVPMLVIALALAAHAAFVHRRNPLLRRQSVIWLFAFGIRDLSYALFLGIPAAGIAPAWLGAPWMFALVLASSWVYLFLLTFGILTTQMFGSDLRLKMGISRGTVAAIIAGVAFVGSEVVEQVFGVDQLLLAIFIAGASTLAFKPLTAVGNRIADQLMPHVEDTDAYRNHRKKQIYAAALAEAEQDGLTPKEKAGIDAVRKRLGLESL